MKELCTDREKKLQLALEEAIALDDAMRETAEWLAVAENKLTTLVSYSALGKIFIFRNPLVTFWKKLKSRMRILKLGREKSPKESNS